jgi:hypothetical protein
MTETTEAPKTIASDMWRKRIQLVIPFSQIKRFNKGKRALVMKDHQLYQISKKAEVDLYDSTGKKLTVKAVKAMLRRA